MAAPGLTEIATTTLRNRSAKKPANAITRNVTTLKRLTKAPRSRRKGK